MLAHDQINLHRNPFEVILPSGKILLVNDVNFELRILKYKPGLELHNGNTMQHINSIIENMIRINNIPIKNHQLCT